MGPGSPLHCAIFRGDKNLATLLIPKGAVLDVHTAVGLGDCSGISLLLERGADIDGRCIDRHSSPVQYLCTTRPNVAQFLLSMGVQADIVSSAACGDIESINRLLSKNSDLINVRINQTSFPPGAEHNVHNTMTFSIGLDATPLHAAAKGDCSDAVAFFWCNMVYHQMFGAVTTRQLLYTWPPGTIAENPLWHYGTMVPTSKHVPASCTTILLQAGRS